MLLLKNTNLLGNWLLYEELLLQSFNYFIQTAEPHINGCRNV